jgi:hypothetical protein
MKSRKYQVIATAAQWAMTDYRGSINFALASLEPAEFTNGLAARAWIWGFSRRADAEMFVARCNTALAVVSGRIGRWIVPTFAIAECHRGGWRAA